MIRQELFKFVEGTYTAFITSGDTEFTYLGDLYEPHPLGRSENESKNELSKSNLEITMGLDDVIARRWVNNVLDRVVSLTMFVVEQETETVTVGWKGRLASVKPTMSTIKLNFENIFTSMRRPGLRRRYQRNCPHVLYGRGCNLDKEDWDIAATVTSIAGNIVFCTEAASSPDGYFRGGMIEAPDGTLRFIMNHVGNQLTLIRPIDSFVQLIEEGPISVRIFPGCDRSRDVCNNTFNNILNNGSTPFIPIINPFGGTPFA